MTTPDQQREAPARDRSPFDTLRTRTLVVYLLISFAGVLIIMHNYFPSLRRDAYASVMALVGYGVMGLVALGRGAVAGVEWRKLFGPPPRARDLPLLAMIVPLALLTAGALTIVFVPLSYLAPDLVEHAILSEPSMFKAETMPQLALLCLALVVAAPVVEEFIFRGLILHRLARRWGTSTGVIGSSIIFAIGHVEWVGHLLIGIAFSIIYLRTRSLWMSMLAHAAYNLLFTIPIAWSVYTREQVTQTTLSDFRAGLGHGVLTFIAGMILMYLYLDLYWPGGRVAEVVAGKVPYENQPADSG